MKALGLYLYLGEIENLKLFARIVILECLLHNLMLGIGLLGLKNVIHQFSEKIDSCIDNRPVCSCYGYRMKILSFSPSEPHEQLQDDNHVVYPEEKMMSYPFKKLLSNLFDLVVLEIRALAFVLVLHQLKHCIETSISYQRPNKRFLVNATDGQPLESEPKNVLNSVKDSLDAFYRFSQPHTVIGTALSIVSVSLLAVEKLTDFSPLFFAGMLEAVAAALLMNIYIVGLNQLYDIDIDKVNKPYLPLASREYSIQTGVMIVASFSVLSFGLGWIVGSWPLFWALFISFALRTAYSINVPLLRWKRFALVAAMCILAVRAVIVQIAFFLHMQTHVFKRPAAFSRPLIFAISFMSFFSVVIALFKVSTFVFFHGTMLYAFPFCLISTVLGHTILASILWTNAKSVDLSSKAAITSFYMFIWKVNNYGAKFNLFGAQFSLTKLQK
ncbi:homogentisate phytyltransferase 1, chloroplastic-like [Humulus lupulus]|uniref:homogentisate phytyltransferase 1, chloroplastic-like n=1 Tax=Humulus lupulus TaxID=3486 RepID=UPI002B404C39|nr:homogentisate phytyltransferase 1, chloroplastic-like [Humulus lupulus]